MIFSKKKKPHSTKDSNALIVQDQLISSKNVSWDGLSQSVFRVIFVCVNKYKIGKNNISILACEGQSKHLYMFFPTFGFPLHWHISTYSQSSTIDSKDVKFLTGRQHGTHLIFWPSTILNVVHGSCMVHLNKKKKTINFMSSSYSSSQHSHTENGYSSSENSPIACKSLSAAWFCLTWLTCPKKNANPHESHTQLYQELKFPEFPQTYYGTITAQRTVILKA